MSEDPSAQAILRIPLTDRISADALARLLDVIDQFYFARLWLERAELAPRGEPFPDAWAPAPDDTLWIERVEIGTPNEMRLKGRLGHLTAVVALLAAALGLPNIPFEAAKIVAETEKTRVETRKAELETIAVELELIEKARRLHAEGRISAEALAHKLEQIEVRRQALPVAAGIIRGVPQIVSADDASSPDLERRLLQRARALGVHDPDLDLFLGVFDDDVVPVQRALDAGANPNVRFGELLDRIRPQVRGDEVFDALLAQLLIRRARPAPGAGA